MSGITKPYLAAFRGSEKATQLMAIVRIAALYLAAGCMFGAIAHLAIDLTRGDGRIAMVWIPNAIAVAALLRWDAPREHLLFAALWMGNVAANLVAGDTFATASTLAASNLVEIGLALFLTRRFVGPRPDMRKVSDLILFVCFAGFCAPAASATIAMTALQSASQDILADWLKWVLTDGLGMILIAPTLLTFIDAARSPRAPTRRECIEWLLLTAIGTTIVAAIFIQTEYPLLFLVMPVVLSHAFRLGTLGTAFSIIKIGTIATLCTWLDRGPIRLFDHSEAVQFVVLQSFLASVFLVGLPVAALLNRQKDLITEMEDRGMQLGLLADNMSDAVMRYDLAGVCTYASASVVDVLGQPREHFVGKGAADDVHPDAKDEIATVKSRLVTGQTERERFTYRRVLDDSDGRPVFIEADCVLVRCERSGEPETIIVSCRDVSERVRLEKNLVRARRHAENAAIAKSQFLANMSHEIRTPMNGVLGFVELLLQSDLPEEQRKHAQLVQESGNSMMRLLNDILDLSKIEAGQIAVTEERVDLRDLVASCLRLHSANAAKKRIKLEEAVGDDLPEFILSDSLRLRQIILNLLGNAVKFTAQGTVTLRAYVDQHHLVIAIQDSGVGIEPTRLEAIFQPFEQADNATSRRFGGTGLGLTISRHMADLLGGRLSASSEPGKGSLFELRIPLVIPEGSEPIKAESRAPAAHHELIAGARILVAEDNDINRVLVSAMLERCGQTVDLVKNGEQAVAAVMEAKAKGAPFDLVLMDVQMPECDGYTATETIRSLGISANELPIVALTANAFEDDIQAALNAGMQAHLAKPLQMEALAGMLQHWLPTIGPRAVLPCASETIGSPVSPSLQERWISRREEAIDAVGRALREGALEGQSAEELARIVHKLAGTAGSFGEDTLGERAKSLELALRSAGNLDARIQAAEALLDAA
ncbi:MASE1 domain-containing protein [Pontixanthobacter aquaemixtae]|uniref:Sensory/regulatory protein RpfC n=1 Tax=Pontixanthobacter aquaemixtae TaxID=1958940 RepID=A0A844ZNL0_9SPHN|nr:MASE1 domain-containing protein [Pontixanthobacter aquaemixtae]MXO89293.1 response regulator [Pontixanthobacter aquaemixtae]